MKHIRILGHIVFFIYAFMAVYFYLERTLYIDSAYSIFNIINAEFFTVEAKRYSVVIPQVFPLLAIHAGLPLKGILLVFSLSFIIVYYLVFLICTYTLKNEIAGITIVLVLCLMIRQSFFHIVTETHQGLIYSCLFYAFLESQNIKNRNTLLGHFYHLGAGSLIILLCFFSHPATIFSLVFILTFILFDKKDYKNVRYPYFILLIFIIYLIKALYTDSNSYEGGFFAELKNSPTVIKSFFDIYSTQFLLTRFFQLYITAFILLASTVLFYLFKKEYKKLVIFPGMIFSALFITNIIYNKGDSDIMMERAYMPFAVMIGIAFFKDLYPFLYGKSKILAPMVVVTILGFSIINIITTSSIFKNRIAYIGNLINNTSAIDSNRKYLLAKEDVNMDIVHIPWTFAVETLLYSSLDDPKASKTIYLFDKAENFDFNRSNEMLFLALPFWLEWDVKSLNNRYFSIGKGFYVEYPKN
jgi:hypothetical protein